MRGIVTAVDIYPARTYLARDVAAEDTDIYVSDANPLADEGASAVLAGQSVKVVSIAYGIGADDPDVVTLAEPVVMPIESGEPVDVTPTHTITQAEVLLDGANDVVDVIVDQKHQSKLALKQGIPKDPKPVVEVEVVDGRHVLAEVEGRGMDDAQNLTGPLPQDVIDESNLPGADLTELYEQLDALAAELADVLPITESKIADNAITTPKLVANAVTTLKLAAEAVTAEKLFVDQAMVTKLVAKMIEVEALNAQVITGIQIVGGSISIAQGVASTLDQDFETASGTTPPSGWTRTVHSSSGSGGGIDFVTSGGNPGRRMRLRTAQVSSGLNFFNATMSPTGLVAQDVVVAIDYRWSGQTVPLTHSGASQIVLRSANLSDEAVAGSVRVHIDNGAVSVQDSGSYKEILTGLPAGAYHRLTVTLRGSSLRVDAVRSDGQVVSGTARLTTNIASGAVAFRSYASGVLGAQAADQTVDIDNVHIEVLQTGLNVAPDGKTSVEYLQVNQAAVVPDPILPTDAMNLRTSNTAVAAAKNRANHTGTQTASTISDFAAAVAAAAPGAKAYQPVTLPGVSPFTDSGSDPSALTLTRIGNVVYASGTLYRPSGTSTTFTNATDVIPVGLRPASAVDWLAPTYNIWNTTSMWGFRIPISGGNAWRAQIRTTAGPGTTGMPMVTFSWVTNDSPTGLTPA